MDDAKMVESLWSLANTITSFAVLQALTFLYALGRPEFAAAIGNRRARRIILSATVVFTVVYSTGIWTCWRLAFPLDRPHDAIWRAVTLGRVACVVMFDLMVLGAAWAARLDLARKTAAGARR
jgi:hypothetical protein